MMINYVSRRYRVSFQWILFSIFSFFDIFNSVLLGIMKNYVFMGNCQNIQEFDFCGFCEKFLFMNYYFKYVIEIQLFLLYV